MAGIFGAPLVASNIDMGPQAFMARNEAAAAMRGGMRPQMQAQPQMQQAAHMPQMPMGMTQQDPNAMPPQMQTPQQYLAPAPQPIAQQFQPPKRTLSQNLGLLADSFRGTRDNAEFYAQQEARDYANWQAQQSRGWQMDDRNFAASRPVFRNTSNEIVQIDPMTGSASQVYKGSLPAEDYAAALGLDPDAPGYAEAMQDYVLRSSGPTAFEFDQQLEGVRHQNRADLEGVRHRNRAELRQTPTYAQSNPRPARGGGGGGRSGAGRAPSLGGVVAPILAKVAQGQKLSAGEQQALDTYYRRGGNRGGGGGARGGARGAARPTATGPNGQKVEWNGSAWVPAR